MKSLTMIRSIAALIILCHQVLTYNLSYSELENLGGSCYPFDSCDPRKDDEDHLWGVYTCECGIHCIRRGTCCIDSPYAGRNLSVQKRGETCQKPPGSVDDVELISRCPDEISGYQAREDCGRINQHGDPLRTTPVTSLETSITYKNFFCAWCNHDAKDFYLWDIHLEPSVTEDDLLEDLFYTDEQKTLAGKRWTGDSFRGVKNSLTVPPELQKFVKRCYPGMVSECAPHYSVEFRNKCSSYYAPIKVKEEDSGLWKVYRNIHCAICNNVSVSQSDDNISCLEGHKARKPPPTTTVEPEVFNLSPPVGYTE